MLKFISFGSGSSGNCYYLFTQTDGLLIDAGVGIRLLKRQFRDFGLSLKNIKNVLITHDHADHVKSVGSLSGDFNLPIYTTNKVHEGINKNYCVKRKIHPSCVKLIYKNTTYQIGEFKVTPFGVPHDSTDNVGYKIEYEGSVFCLMTDVGHVTEEMKGFVTEANYLVIEANYDKEMLYAGSYPMHLKERITGENGHLSNNECAETLVNNASPNLKQVWLCHLSEENNHPELARKTVESVLRSNGIICGVDFHLEILKRKTASGAYELK